MSSFARLKHIQDYDRVSYYSICLSDDPENLDSVESMYESFLRTHGGKHKKKVVHIANWLKEIGEKYGAQEHLFRDEQNQGEANGLPPKGTDRPPTYTEDGKNIPNNLRLYCYRLNEHVVILFSGDIKTAKNAQDCANVKSHFELANQLTKAIDLALKEKEITWIDDFTNIAFDIDMIMPL
ncbi:hypothetical protein [Flagellimonas halotolerans]|uniref:Uncharacterized protein n=1 Tax=Flagellimonas halotolerans TaxID=3112164 RepID=A0ABU6IQR2_9FLAO|nr:MULTISPECIES: hypothetical protein [unclassified Allomuricauda]MEC3965588.1 hypothetical protein [Muricauda sp. SYSU M86414]MEC4265454.1 hypothetical protein [Muricauda sp. SYSU M84420]